MNSNALRARLLTLRGDVDFTSASKLEEISTPFGSCDVVVLDLQQLGFVDTTFLRFLLKLAKQAREHVLNPVRLIAPAPRARRLLDVTGLSRRFAIYETLEQSLRDVPKFVQTGRLTLVA